MGFILKEGEKVLHDDQAILSGQYFIKYIVFEPFKPGQCYKNLFVQVHDFLCMFFDFFSKINL